MKGKKAAGHVEVIISFVIFVGFLIFLMFIFNPLQLLGNSSLVDSVLIKMEDNLKIDVISVSLSLNDPADVIDGCFSIPDIEDLNCDDKVIRVLDKEGNADIEAKIDNTIPNDINILIKKDGNNKLYTIICSEDNTLLDTGLASCTSLDNTQFKLGIISEKRIWSDKKFGALEGEYKTNDASYLSVKESYVSGGSDFGFRLWDLDNLAIPLYKAGEPPGTNVDAKTIPVDVIDANGIVIKRTLTIMTW